MMMGCDDISLHGSCTQTLLTTLTFFFLDLISHYAPSSLQCGFFAENCQRLSKVCFPVPIEGLRSQYLNCPRRKLDSPKT